MPYCSLSVFFFFPKKWLQRGKAYESADGDACGDGGDRAGAHVAGDAAGGGQRAEDEGDGFEALRAGCQLCCERGCVGDVIRNVLRIGAIYHCGWIGR